MRILFFLFAILIQLLSSIDAHAQLVSYQFNSGQSDFNTNFLETLSAGSPAWASGGMTSTGGVNHTDYLTTNSSSQAALWSAGYNWTSGGILSMSIYFKARVDASTGAGENLLVGLDASNAGVLSGGQYLAFGLQDGSASDNLQLTVISRESGTTTTKSGSDLGVLTDNNWYQISANITKKATSGQFSLALSLYHWGTDGVTGGSQVGSTFTLDATGAATGLTTLWNDTDAYFGFRAAVASGQGVRGIDNFTVSVVPEPSTWAMLIIAAFLAGQVFWNSRRSRSSLD